MMPARSLAPAAPRRPSYKVRSQVISLTVTPSDRDYIDGASRRSGKPVARLLGDLVEQAIRLGLLERLSEGGAP